MLNTKISTIGMILSLATFFIALFMKDSIHGHAILIYPSSILAGMFFIGYGQGTNLVSGIKFGIMRVITFLIYGIVTLITVWLLKKISSKL